MRLWSKEEDNKLQELYIGNIPNGEIARILKRTLMSVYSRSKKLKLCKAHYQELHRQILSLYNSGEYSNRQIGRKLNISRDIIASHLRKEGLRSRWFQINKLQMVDENAICKKCNKPKPIEQFQYGRRFKAHEYKFAYCNECRKKQGYLRLNNDVGKFLSDRYQRMKRRAKMSPKNRAPRLLTISKEDFINQYFEQKGKCFYTDEVMRVKIGEGKSWSALSIDKIIPELGYIKCNIVFCTMKVNAAKFNFSLLEMKKWMPKWYKRIIKFAKEHNCKNILKMIEK